MSLVAGCPACIGAATGCGDDSARAVLRPFPFVVVDVLFDRLLLESDREAAAASTGRPDFPPLVEWDDEVMLLSLLLWRLRGRPLSSFSSCTVRTTTYRYSNRNRKEKAQVVCVNKNTKEAD